MATGTIGFTAENLKTLTEALAQGARRVRYGDKEIEYYSLSEMLQLKSQMERAVNPPARSANTVFPTYSKGA